MFALEMEAGAIFSHHLEWVVQQWDTILKGDHLSNISAKLALIWFSSFRGQD
jgi:hypothetical protein